MLVLLICGWGEKKRDFDLVDGNGERYNFETKVRGSMSPLHFKIRVDPMHYTNFPIMPYVGAFTGIRFFASNRRNTIDYQNSSEPTTENNREISVTSSYGIEAGIHIRISKELIVNFSYEHAYGGKAKYLDVSSIEIDENGSASYERLKTRTHASIYTLGLVFDI